MIKLVQHKETGMVSQGCSSERPRTYHLGLQAERSRRTPSTPLAVFLVVILVGESSSTSLDHRKSTSFRAMQLMVTTLKVGGMANSVMIELTKAVFPVPGDPEMYKEVYCMDGGFLVSPTNEVMNSLMSARSVARPDNDDMPFDVDLRSPRARE